MLDLATFNPSLAKTLKRELDEVTLVFERQLASELSAVNRLCVHVEQYRGKMLRPILVLLSGLAIDDDGPGPGHRTLAAVVEMIHMATLVHDDILDEAEVRRGGSTVNHLWGNEAAVMLGDYLISNSFHLCSSLGEPSINLELGRVTNTLCEGELAQLHHRHDCGITEDTYFEIIRRKTASLIAACCQLGGQLAGGDAAATRALHEAGLALGVAFQIQDDLLDLVGEEGVVGKTLGRDLQKGKLTLPIITHLQQADPEQRGATLRIIEAGDIDALRATLQASGAVASTRHAAEREIARAKTHLAELPDSDARTMFTSLAEMIPARVR